MAKVIARERLRDQVYNLVRDDLISGAAPPGQRMVEADLAERYGVSRTPVREALFQLARDRLLIGNERGYIVPPLDTRQAIVDRLEVRRLIEPRVVRHVATDSTPEQRKVLRKAFEKQRSAHEAGRYKQFVDANHLFRTALRAMCSNELLTRCASIMDDQFQATRNVVHESAKNRAEGLEYDAKLLAAIEAGDADAAERETLHFLDTLEAFFAEHPEGS